MVVKIVFHFNRCGSRLGHSVRLVGEFKGRRSTGVEAVVLVMVQEE